MIKKINSTDEFFKRLEKEGKVKYLDKPEHYRAIEEVNEGMRETRREYIRMNIESEISARDFYFTD